MEGIDRHRQDPGFGDLPSPLVCWVPANTLLSIFVGVVPKQVMFIRPAQPQEFDPGPTRAGFNPPAWTHGLQIPLSQIGVHKRLQNLS